MIDGAPDLVDDDTADLYERAPCGYLSTTPNGTIVTVNATFLDLTGYARADLVRRRTFAELLTPGGRIYHETHLAPMLHAIGSASQIALDIVTAGGDRLPVLVNAVLARTQSGQPVIRAAVFDATDRREYERELVRAKERAESSESMARLLVRTLQETLIPPAVPSIDGLDVAATYRPAAAGDEVGGDFYDIFEIAADDWIVVVGDVTGKGVDAAMITALARYTIRAAAIRTGDPRHILGTLNDVLRRDETNRLCTAVIARLTRRRDSWEATISHGGHPLGLLMRRGQEITELGGPGTLLGAFEDPTFVVETTPLQQGDAVVLFTDGVTEGRCGRELFGEERTHASLQHHIGSANGLTYGLLDDVLQFQAGPTSDDIVIVTVQVPVGGAAT